MSTLKQIARNCGLYFDVATNYWAIQKDVQKQQLLPNHFRGITAENDFKLNEILPLSPTEYDWRFPDWFANYCLANSMPLKAHAIIYQKTIKPKWWWRYPNLIDGLTIKEYLKRHVFTVMQKYKNAIQYAEITNEDIDTGKLYNDNHLDIIEFFETAHAAAPNVKKIYNDFGFQAANQQGSFKRELVLHLVDCFKQKNVPLDAVGVQCHLEWKPNYDIASEVSALHYLATELGKYGIPLLVTEFDVKDYQAAANFDEIEVRAADLTLQFMKALLTHRNIKGVTVWGAINHESWNNQGINKRIDGLPHASCLFKKDTDGTYVKTKLYEAFIDAIQGQAGRAPF